MVPVWKASWFPCRADDHERQYAEPMTMRGDDHERHAFCVSIRRIHRYNSFSNSGNWWFCLKHKGVHFTGDCLLKFCSCPFPPSLNQGLTAFLHPELMKAPVNKCCLSHPWIRFEMLHCLYLLLITEANSFHILGITMTFLIWTCRICCLITGRCRGFAFCANALLTRSLLCHFAWCCLPVWPAPTTQNLVNGIELVRYNR